MSLEAPKSSSDDKDPLQIVLIGLSGSGKSSTGNTILGKNHFHSEACGKSVTLKCEKATEIVNGRQVTVVDTPGWDCTELSKDQVAKEIKNALQNLHGPYAFLLVIPVGPVESPDIQKIYDLKNVLGPSYLQHTAVLFSRSDNLEDKPFDQFLHEGGEEFQMMLACCEYRLHYWNNRNRRNVENVEKVLHNLKMAENKSPQSPQGSYKEMESGQDRYHSAPPQHFQEKRLKGESEQKPKDLRVLLLGMSKTGKTSSIKTLLGKSAPPENRGCQVFTGTKSGWNLKVIESPGFEDSTRIQDDIFKCLSEAAPGPHVIIIVMSVERFTPAKKKTMYSISEHLGQNVTKYTLVLFTGKDNLEGKSIERYVEENADLKHLVVRFGGRFHAVNNRDISNQTEGDALLQKIIEIQRSNNADFFKMDQHVAHSKEKKGVWDSVKPKWMPKF